MAVGSSPIGTFNKDPNAVLEYTMNWRGWLQDDTIIASSWTVPAGISNAGEVYSSTSATLWLSGGTAGTSYSIVNQITTAQGRSDKRTFKINVIDR